MQVLHVDTGPGLTSPVEGDYRIRPAAGGDAAQIQQIYAPIVAGTPISFETDPPSTAEMRTRIATVGGTWPWLVAARGERIFGYAYASRHRERGAYRYAADVSAYVAEDARGRGVGRSLYAALLALLRHQGFYRAYAGIALPNPASVALHERAGFKPVGVYERVGFKMGRWHDVGWWARALREPDTPGGEPVPFAALGAEEIDSIVAAAVSAGTRTAG